MGFYRVDLFFVRFVGLILFIEFSVSASHGCAHPATRDVLWCESLATRPPSL